MAQTMGARYTLPGRRTTLPGVCRRCNRTQLVQVYARRFPVAVPAMLVLAVIVLLARTWVAGGPLAGTSGLTTTVEILLTAAAWVTLFARKVTARCPQCDETDGQVAPIEAPGPGRRGLSIATSPEQPRTTAGPAAVPPPAAASPAVNVLHRGDRDLDMDLSFLDTELDRVDPKPR